MLAARPKPTTTAATPPARPIPSATVVILRDRPGGLEVFMVVRHHAIDFASGALVFPGGKLEAGDADPAWGQHLDCTEAAEEHTYRIAAARETFEEAGLLVARRRGERSLVDADTTHALVERFRAGEKDQTCAFRDLIAAEGLQLATELMVPFAHWITPEALPKRFDTKFFIVAAPVEQLGLHDGSESVDGLWIPPATALREAEEGKRTLVFATLMNLKKLAAFASVAEAVGASRAARIVTVMPEITRTAKGRVLRIPAEAGYGITEMEIPAGAG